MPIDLCVFDVAGTTIVDDGAVARILAQTLSDRGVEVTREEAAAVMGMPKPVAISALLAAHRPRGPDAAEVATLHTHFVEAMIEHYRKAPGVEPLGETRKALAALRRAGVRVALDTGFDRRILEVLLRRVDLEPGRDLDATVCSDEVPRGRPHPDMILRAMRLCDVTAASRVAKIGDTVTDVREGHAAGCGLVVGVTSGTATAAELAEAGADAIRGDVAEFVAALLADRAKVPRGRPREGARP